jgi:hypothetical protein
MANTGWGNPGTTSRHKTAYGYDMRVLSCAQCAAPIEGTLHGGAIACQYCHANNQITARDERLDHQLIQAAPQMTEAQRFERLRQQDGQPLVPPPAFMPFLEGGGLQDHNIPAMLQQWKMAKDELARGGGFQVAERLYFATLMLRGPMSKQGQDLHVRAMIETALERMTEPRHRNVLHGFLARDATRLGDPEAGEKWLALMTPHSDDLHIDSAYRITRACVSTAKQDFNTVLAVLGQRKDDVPISDGQDELAAVLRANAFERQGRGQEAVQHLQQIMISPGHAQLVGKIIEGNAALQLCPHSYPQAAQAAQNTKVVRTKSGINIGAIILVSVLGAPLMIAASAAMESGGLPSWAFGIIVTGFVLFTFATVVFMITRSSRIKKRLKKSGVRGSATLLEAKGTGTRVNGQPMMELILNIEAPGLAPYRASHREVMGGHRMAQLQGGMRLPILLDPQDPTIVAIDWPQ